MRQQSHIDAVEAVLICLFWLATIALFVALATGCRQNAQQPATSPPPGLPAAGAGVTDAAADVADSAEAMRRFAAAIREYVAVGSAKAAALVEVWNGLSAQAGGIERTGEVLAAKEAAFARVQQNLKAATTQASADRQVIADLRSEIGDLKASTSREAERASAWGVVVGAIMCAAGVALMLITQSPAGKGLAIGGLVLSGALVAAIQLFRAGDAIAPLMPWAFGGIGILFIAWIGWEVWRRRAASMAYATELEKRSFNARLNGQPGDAEALQSKATAIHRAIDATYDRLWRRAK